MGRVPRRYDVMDSLERIGKAEFSPTTRFAPAWTAPTFVNSWAQYTDAEYGTAGYWLQGNGKVVLRGGVMHPAAGAAGTTIFTLPVGLRPLKNKIWPVMTGNGIERLTVFSSGAVAYGGVAGTVAWLFLDPISFWPGS